MYCRCWCGQKAVASLIQVNGASAGACMQTVLDLEPLESGQSTDVTGRLAVMRQACPGSVLNEEPDGRAASSQLFHYKLLDASAAYYLQS